MTDSSTSKLRSMLLTVVALSLIAATAAAAPFTDLVVFGDSLSDIGNISQATGGFQPGPYYWNGRVSNGPVYAESLATGLGLPALARSTAGGSNFAYAGAQTAGTGGLYGFFIHDIDEQIADFGSGTFNSGSLVVVFAGANDLINGQTNVNVPINNLAVSLATLIAHNARQFLVLNLPPLGETPSYNGNSTTRSQFNALAEQYNAALATMLDSVQTNNPAVTIFRLDVASMFRQLLADPALFGLTNVTDAAAPGLQRGALSYNTSLIVPNPNEYAFWDDLHPTKAVHAILAQRALDLFRLPGDYNQDGAVDAADYVTWRNGLGSSYSPYDYELWHSNFAASSGTGSSQDMFHLNNESNHVVPEPSIIFSALITGCIPLCFLRCGKERNA